MAFKLISNRRKRVALPVALMLFGAPACGLGSDDDPTLGEMTLSRVAGRVVIIRSGEEITVSQRAPLQEGDTVETPAGATAQLRLAGDRTIEMAPESLLHVDGSTVVDSERGSVLALAGDSLTVTFGEVRASSDGGVFRIDQGSASARAASYQGEVKLSAPGQSRVEVARLFEVPVAANDLRSPAPYQLDGSDSWDQQYLRTVVDLQTDLMALSSALENQLGRQRPTLGYFKGLAPEADVSFLRSYLEDRSPVDLLTAFTIAGNAPGPLEASFERAFALHDAGGDWAVVAALMDASFEPLLAQLKDAIVGTGLVAARPQKRKAFRVAAGISGASRRESAAASPQEPPVSARRAGVTPGANSAERRRAALRDRRRRARADRQRRARRQNRCEGTVDCTIDSLTRRSPVVVDGSGLLDAVIELP